MSKTIQLNGYAFDSVTQGSGEKIILIHGSNSDRRTWEKQVEEWSADYQVISYSRRSHYPNQKIDKGQDYSMQQHVNDLKDLIHHFGGEPVHVVGHSYGALMGLELAVTNPEMIKKLVLMEPPAIRLFVSNIPKPSELLSLLFKRPSTALSIIKLGATGLGPATKAAEKGDLQKAMELSGKAILGKETFMKMREERKEQALVNLTAAELTGSGFLAIDDEKIKKIDLPVLLMGGDKSPSIFRNLINRLMELLPKAKYVEIKNASHILHEDNPSAYTVAVRSFLKA